MASTSAKLELPDMPRICFPARIIHAPQASRMGGRRTLRDNVRLGTRGRARRDVGKRGRSVIADMRRAV